MGSSPLPLFSSINRTVQGGGSMANTVAEAASKARPGLGKLFAVGLNGAANAYQPAGSGMMPAPPMMQGQVIDTAAGWQPYQPTQQFGGYRALGGPVNPDEAYIVGENGPELFKPDQPGTVVPNGLSQPQGNIDGKGPQTQPQFPVTANQPAAGGSPAPSPYTGGGADSTLINSSQPYGRGIPATTPPSTLDQLKQAIGAKPGQYREHSFWKRLGQGLEEGLGDWARSGAPGGAIGALSALATGGVGYGFDPSMQAAGHQANQVGKLWNRFQQESAIQQQQAQSAKSQLDLQGQLLDVTKKSQDVAASPMEKALKSAWDATGQGRVPLDPVMKRQIENSTGVQLPDRIDWSKYENVVRNGVTYSQNEYGRPTAARNTDVPVEATQVPYSVTSPVTGTQVPATGPQILNSESQQSEAQANREQRTNEDNVRNQLDVDKTNASNMLNWSGHNLTLLQNIRSQFGDNIAATAGAQGAYDKMSEANDRVQQYGSVLANIPAGADNDKERAAAQRNLDKATQDFANAQSSFEGTMGKANGGAQIMQSLQQFKIPAPQKVQFHPITPANPQNKSPKNLHVGTQADLDNALKRLKGSK